MMIKIKAISVEHNPVAVNPLIASVDYESLLNVANKNLSTSDKLRLSVCALVSHIAGENLSKFNGESKLNLVLRKNSDDLLVIEKATFNYVEDKEEFELVKVLSDEDNKLLSPMFDKYNEFLLEENK